MKVVQILAPGFEEVEAISPIDYLRRAGVEVTVAGIAAPNESYNKVICGAHGIKVECDISFDEYIALNNSELPDAIVIPGGMPGALNISLNDDVINFILKMNQENKLICAICASPIVVLAKTGLLSGKEFTCYPGMENCVNQFVPENADVSELLQNSTYNKNVAYVKNGNLITARGPGAAEEFSMKIVESLVGVDEMNNIKAASVLR